jgi:hypothetical protein
VPEPERIPRERLAELVSAASYGTVLVLAALSVIGVSDVALGVGSELVAGVGVATFLAHLFAELLANHVRYHQPLRGDEILRDMVDGSPILFSTVLPALMLMLGRFDVLGGQRGPHHGHPRHRAPAAGHRGPRGPADAAAVGGPLGVRRDHRRGRAVRGGLDRAAGPLTPAGRPGSATGGHALSGARWRTRNFSISASTT